MKRTYGLLTSEEQELLKSLTQHMSNEQLLWTSGYMAGLASRQHTSPVNWRQTTIQVLYGTHTGNSQSLAEKLVARCKAQGLDISSSAMETYPFEELYNAQTVIIIISTHGDGDEPENATLFLQWLNRAESTKLNHLNYAVLGLGDSSYDNFCGASEKFETALKNLRAKPIIPITKCDVDYESTANVWIEKLLSHLTGSTKPAEIKTFNTIQPLNAVMPAVSFKRIYNSNMPFYATVIKKVLLSKPGSDKEVYHFELSLKGSGFTYKPGDTISIFPNNPPTLVNEIITHLRVTPHTEVIIDKKPYDLELALRNKLEITVLTKAVLEKYQQISTSKVLENILSDAEKLSKYLRGNDVLDMLIAFPCIISAQQLVNILRVLPARKYSIASAMEATPNEAHITVAAVRFEQNGREHYGACSTFVADRINAGDKVPVLVNANRKFSLPEQPNRPLIMIGPGTGIAPFRGFMQYRKAKGIKNNTWLFFGDRHEKFDFLYADEWAQLKQDGYLEKLDTAFSRDTEQKTYVQHQLSAHGSTVWQWLEYGAHVYVCGDKKRMATDVHLTLLEIISKHGKMDINSARTYLNKMTEDKRYQKDVY